jgi:hypothetical protein
VPVASPHLSDELAQVTELGIDLADFSEAG